MSLPRFDVRLVRTAAFFRVVAHGKIAGSGALAALPLAAVTGPPDRVPRAAAP